MDPKTRQKCPKHVEIHFIFHYRLLAEKSALKIQIKMPQKDYKMLCANPGLKRLTLTYNGVYQSFIMVFVIWTNSATCNDIPPIRCNVICNWGSELKGNLAVRKYSICLVINNCSIEKGCIRAAGVARYQWQNLTLQKGRNCIFW